MMKSWFNELWLRNPLLAKSGGFCFLLGFFIVFIPLADPRELQGFSIWIKPAKFFISIGIFFWTMGWLMDYLKSEKFVKWISWGIWVLMLIELVIITFQASQGKLSHYNISSVWDAVLFQIMGIAITLNSALVFLVLLKFFQKIDLPKGYLMGIRIGLVIFLIAGFEGFVMVGQLKHTVGAEDGQAGLPFLGWAKAYGDLRIFHFLGLHGLQILPLQSWFFLKNHPGKVLLVGLLYFLFSFGTLWMALQGKGILGWF
ncbi:hypothetical protein [Algoriphagus sp. A40]|uniref:hypothetical protein n=1 Tax=Algoriphagus sp. A40 TaxID=1945863 RepID=UPI001115882F|nr:hypothetical protein [Algoriphagus sp. A40]